MQRHLLLCEEVLKDAYEVQRDIASQVVVYLLADLDRFWKDEQPHAIPILYFFRGHSLSVDVRKITESCKEECRSSGLDLVVTAADGEFTQLIVRGHDGSPLTQHQLTKDVWKEAGQMTKNAILDVFLEETKEVSETTANFPNNSNVNGFAREAVSETSALETIRTPKKGWVQKKTETSVESKNHTSELSVQNENVDYAEIFVSLKALGRQKSKNK